MEVVGARRGGDGGGWVEGEGQGGGYRIDLVGG